MMGVKLSLQLLVDNFWPGSKHAKISVFLFSANPDLKHAKYGWVRPQKVIRPTQKIVYTCSGCLSTIFVKLVFEIRTFEFHNFRLF